MTCPKCGGPATDITTNDDRAPVFMCTDCGHQGPAREFPDPETEEPAAPSGVRAKVSGFLARLSERIAPK